MYRKQWVIDILNGRSIVQCALDVHMANMGSSERSAVDQMNDFRALCEILESWRPSSVRSVLFDDAVYDAVRAAVHEVIFGYFPSIEQAAITYWEFCQEKKNQSAFTKSSDSLNSP